MYIMFLSLIPIFHFFQIAGTPAAERLRRQKAAEDLANAHVSKLILTPFTQIPKISYENVKLGMASVRMLLLQNLSKQPVEVGYFILPDRCHQWSTRPDPQSRQ